MTEEDDFLFRVYSTIAEQIIKEDARINERMTWGISINGGLLALLGVSYKPLQAIFASASCPVIICISVSLVILPIAAMLVCYQTIRGVGDARKQISDIKKIYDTKWKKKIEGQIGLPPPFGRRHFYAGQESGIAKSLWWGENLLHHRISLADSPHFVDCGWRL